MSDSVAGKLSERHAEALQEFVLLWGEMANSWGINRTMAQIHALLYVSEEPLDTDSVMQALQISRGNASTNLRHLMNWNLIRKVHLKGSRRDHYAAEKDVWKIASTVILERQKREIKPVRESLERWVREFGEKSTSADNGSTVYEREFRERIEAFADLLQLFEDFVEIAVPMLNEQSMRRVKQLAQFGSIMNESGEEAGIRKKKI